MTMTYPQQPMAPHYTHPAPPVPRKKKSNAGLIVAIVVGSVILMCGVFAIVGALVSEVPTKHSDSAAGNAPAAKADGKPAAAGLNQPTRDGKFQFTVTKVECGIARIGDDYLNRKAQGQFCKVTLTVQNIGDEARMFNASSQFAFNATGQKYDADAAAGLYLQDAGNAFLNNINPGNSVTGTIVFDIPKGAAISKLELHDSSFSGGVTVNM